jgi:hypothetical protein
MSQIRLVGEDDLDDICINLPFSDLLIAPTALHLALAKAMLDDKIQVAC